MKVLRSVIYCFVLLVFSANAAADEPGEKISLKTAVFDGCPFICLDGRGIFLDVLRSALKDTNYQIDLVALPFKRAQRALESGEIDLFPGILKDGIDGAVYPDDWLYFTQMCFYVRSRDKWNYDGVQSLANRSLAVELGIIHTPEIFDFLQYHPSVVRLSGENVLNRQVELVERGRADTFTAEQTLFKIHHGQQPNPPRLRQAGCLDPEHEYVAISQHRSDAPSLAALLSERLAAARSSINF